MQNENPDLYRKLVANASKYPISMRNILLLDDIELKDRLDDLNNTHLIQKCVIFGAYRLASYYLAVDISILSLIKKIKLLVLRDKDIRFNEFALFVLNTGDIKCCAFVGIIISLLSLPI
jgi:hypothetical protein